MFKKIFTCTISSLAAVTLYVSMHICLHVPRNAIISFVLFYFTKKNKSNYPVNNLCLYRFNIFKAIKFALNTVYVYVYV